MMHVNFKLRFRGGGMVSFWRGLLNKTNSGFVLVICVWFWIRARATAVAVIAWLRRTIWLFIASKRGVVKTRRAFARARVRINWTTRGSWIIISAWSILWSWRKFFIILIISRSVSILIWRMIVRGLIMIVFWARIWAWVRTGFTSRISREYLIVISITSTTVTRVWLSCFWRVF